MDAARKRALRRYNPELRTEIIVNNLLPDLHRDAGGFLTGVESLAVSSKRCNVGQVDELITILLTKENADFDSFCHVLKKGDYRRWSEVLSRSAASAKRGAPGGAECVVARPLIHSIKTDYLKVKNAFCGSPSMPSLDALKDRCEDLILVAFSDGPQISCQESTIRKVETVRELAQILFFTLSRWISFDFLDKVIEHFQPQLKDVKEQLTQYKEKLREILMEKLKEIGELQQKQEEEEEEEEEETSGLGLTEIVAKYRLDADGLKVQDLITERDFMAQRLGIPEYLLQVLSWRQGSVIIVFLLLRELQPLVEVALRRSDVCAQLSSHGMEALYLNGCSPNLLDRSSDCQPRALATAPPPPGSHVTSSVVERSLKEDNAHLRKKLKELEEISRWETEELMARCAAAEEGRRRAEEERRQCDLRVAEAEASQQKLQGENHELASTLAEMKAKLVSERHGSDEKAKKLKKENDKLRKRITSLQRENAKQSEELEAVRREVDYLSLLAFTPGIVSLEMEAVLVCQDRDVQNHLKTFYDNLDTSPMHLTYTTGSPSHDWRCLAEHVGLHEADLSATSCERRVRIICDEWAKKETVTVAKVHQVLTKAQCTRAAECLLSAAQSMAEQEEGDVLLDLEGQPEVIL